MFLSSIVEIRPTLETMKITSLVLALLLLVGRTIAQRSAPVVAFEAQGAGWALDRGSVVKVDPNTGKWTRFYVDEDSTNAGEQMIGFTSQNSPLVQGEIKHVSVAHNGSIWMVSAASEVSVFDGRQWETITGVCKHHGSAYHCFDDALLTDRSLRLVTCSGVYEVSTNDYKVRTLLEVSSWSSVTVDLESSDTLRLKGHLRGWYSLSTRVSSITDTELAYLWIRTDPETSASYAGGLERSLQLRRELMPDVEWVYGDHPYVKAGLPPYPHELAAPLPHHGGSRNALAYSIARDSSDNVYIASQHGVVIVPTTERDLTPSHSSQQMSISIVPNPANTTATIELGHDVEGSGSVEVISRGRSTVLRLDLTSRQTTLDISRLPVGWYTVVVTIGTSHTSKALLVAR